MTLSRPYWPASAAVTAGVCLAASHLRPRLAVRLYTSFAHAQASGQVEGHGVLLSRSTFQAGFVGPADARITYGPPDFTLAASSNAIDRGARLPGLNDGFTGAGPDLGALERGCPVPTYGPRAEGLESFTWLINCGNLFNSLAEATLRTGTTPERTIERTD